MLRRVRWRKEVFVVPVPAGDEGTAFDHRAPEEPRGEAVALVTGYRGEPLEADDLGDLRVRVQAVERIAAVGERYEEGLVAEAARQFKVSRVARQLGHVHEHFV